MTVGFVCMVDAYHSRVLALTYLPAALDQHDFRGSVWQPCSSQSPACLDRSHEARCPASHNHSSRWPAAAAAHHDRPLS